VATSVYSAFDELHGRLTPLTGEVVAASSHRASVEAAIKSDFSLNRFFQSGSWGNGTSVRTYSDVDYFASLDHSHWASSSTDVLKGLRTTLARRFATTAVWVDSPAIMLEFGRLGSERYEVVPSFIEDTSDTNAFVYLIPAPGGGWMRSSPEGQRGFVAAEHIRLKEKLRPLIRFLKLWKYVHDVPISSYYLELFATHAMKQEQLIIYSWDLHAVFRELYRENLPPIANPGKVGATVEPCPSWKRSEVKDAVMKAHVRSELAREAETEKDEHKAFILWNMLFDGHFPTYG
jgi:hypothetical protein